jgi:N-methylhydantoinase A
MHAIPIARELAIASVLVPANPGTGSAFGLLCTDLQHDYVRTYVTPIRDADHARIRSLLGDMADQGRRTLAAEGIAPKQMALSYVANMRYQGQSWQLNVPIEIDATMGQTEEAFHEAYHDVYGYSRREMVVELVYLRVLASAYIDKPNVARAKNDAPADREPPGQQPVYFDGEFRDTSLYQREALRPKDSIAGPAIIEEAGATTVLFPQWRAVVDAAGNLRLAKEPG